MIDLIKKYRNVLIVALLLLSVQVQAQTILDTARVWTSEAYINLYDASQQPASFVIRTTGSAITLTYGGQSKQLDIVSTSGTWSNVLEDGEITCTVSFSGATGTVTIARVSNAYAITVDFSQQEHGMKRKFLISTHSPE